MALTDFITTIEIRPNVVGSDAINWMRAKAKDLFDDRNTHKVPGDFDSWFNGFVDAHQPLWNQLGGTRVDVDIDVGSLSDMELVGILGSVNGRYDSAMRDISYACFIYGRGSTLNTLFDGHQWRGGGNSSYPDWVFTGQLGSGTKWTRILSRMITKSEKALKQNKSTNSRGQILVCNTRMGEYRAKEILELAKRGMATMGGLRADIKSIKEKSVGLSVAIVAEPHHFLRFGTHNGVDDGSCFKAGSDFEYAPFCIADHPRSVVYYTKSSIDGSTSKIFGRAWGAVFPDCAITSNVYPNRDTQSRALVNLLIGKALDSVFKNLWEDGLVSKPGGECINHDDDGIVYLNGDEILYRPRHANFSPPIMALKEADYCRTVGVGQCEHCDETIQSHWRYNSVAGGGFVCGCCSDESYVYSERYNTLILAADAIHDDYHKDYIYEHDAVELVNHTVTYFESARLCNDGEFHLDDHCVVLASGGYSPQDQCTKCYCGEYYDTDDVILLEHGEYAGQYSYCNDPRLVEIDDEWGIV